MAEAKDKKKEHKKDESKRKDSSQRAMGGKDNAKAQDKNQQSWKNGPGNQT